MIIHIDMDAFYASVEQLDRPALRGKCVIVGGQSGRGVVSAASYEARKFGVHSAMPMFEAKQRCPHGIFLPVRMDRYKEVSEEIMAILHDFSPVVEQISIDEAYIDITGCYRIHGGPAETAEGIKGKIKETVGLTCSIGIAPTKVIAKIASDMDKPDGLYIIEQNEVVAFMEKLPVKAVPGVGKKTEARLKSMGVMKLGDIRKYPENVIFEKLGKFGQRLMELSAVIDHSPVAPEHDHKSVSTETTLPEDTDNRQQLEKYLLMQSEEVGKELRRLNVKARTIFIKIKDADFRQATRSITVDIPAYSSEVIYREAAALFKTYRISKKIRLVGVGATGFVPARTPVQMSLFKDGKRRTGKWESIDKAVDSIRRKFGEDAVKRAALQEKNKV